MEDNREEGKMMGSERRQKKEKISQLNSKFNLQADHREDSLKNIFLGLAAQFVIQ